MLLTIKDNYDFVLQVVHWHGLCCTTGLDPLGMAHDWRACNGHRSLLMLALALASQPISFTLGGRFGR